METPFKWFTVLLTAVGGIIVLLAVVLLAPLFNVLFYVASGLALFGWIVFMVGKFTWSTIRGRHTITEVLVGLGIVAFLIWAVYLARDSRQELDLDCIAANGISYLCP